MNYKILTLHKKEEWASYLAKLPSDQQDIYYTPEYYSLYQNYGDGKAQCFVFEKDANIALYPFLINSVNKLGYDLDDEYYDIQGAYGYNGVVGSSYDEDFIKAFYSAFEEYCNQNNIIAEFIRLNPLISNPNHYRNSHEVVYNRKTVFFDLIQSEDEVFEKFQHTTKKQIKRAVNRFGITLEVYKKLPVKLDQYFRIYTSTMDRAKASNYLYFTKDYFKEFVKLGNTVLLVANYHQTPISVIFGMYYGKYFHGHVGGSIHQYMKMSPSSFLYWEMFKYAKSLGCRFLHLGGGNNYEADDPLLKFKMNFSKSTLDFYIAKKIHNVEIYNEVIKQWSNRNPNKIKSYQNVLLKYHF